MLRRLSLKNALKWRITQQIRSAATDTEEQIIIPNAIPRKPTDILYALSATVGQDTTAAHFKYHDDPYLIPLSNLTKQSYAAAQESGRKSARWILENNQHLFNHSEADPVIEVFKARQVAYTEKSEVDEENLRSLIHDVEVEDAILVYDLLKQKGIEVSQATKLDLMQLLCFFNHEDTLNEEWIEERWFEESKKNQRDRPQKTWKAGLLAENLFAEIKPKDSRTYCTIIRGMCKFHEAERAYTLYQEALDKGIALDVGTYNSMLSVVNLLKATADLRWELLTEILGTMKERTLMPDLGTLNAVLQSISSMGAARQNRVNTLRTLAEFKKLGIEPSLASYYYVLIIFCADRGPVSHVLVDIMNEIQGKSFEIRDKKDIFFFTTAMDVCKKHLNDINLAKRVDALLHTANNYNLIGDTFKETVYYRNYVSLMAVNEPIDVFMETYHRLVPSVHTPEPTTMQQILRTVDLNSAIEYIPELWSHIVMFDFSYNESIVTLMLDIMVKNPPSEPEMVDKFNDIAYGIYMKQLEQLELRTRQHRISGKVLGDILLVLSRGNDVEKAQTVFEKINNSQNQLLFEPVPLALQSFIQLCVQNKMPSVALTTLQYMVENGYGEAKVAGEELLEKVTLSEKQRLYVNQLLSKPVD